MTGALERFANIPVGTVTAGGTTAPAAGTVETWTVTATTAFPAVSVSPGTQFHVCDPNATSEQVLVTVAPGGTGAGQTWTVTRGAEGTTPVAHGAGFTIFQVTTAGWLNSVVTYLQPSGDTSGATDFSNLTQALAAGPVFPGPGVFWFNQVPQIPGYAVLVGTGPLPQAQGTVFRMAAGANLAAVAASAGWTASTNTTVLNPAYIRGICFDGNQAAQSSGAGHGLVLQTFRSSVIDCQWINTRGDGLRFDQLGANGTTAITNTGIENQVINPQCRNIGAIGIHVNDPTLNLFTDGFIGGGAGVVEACGAQGIKIDASAGWVVTDTHVYGTAFSGIVVGRMFATRIIGCYVEDWGTSSTLGSYAAYDAANIFINDGGTGSAITGNAANLNAAPGNAGSSMSAVAIESATGDTGTVSVTGNAFDASDNTFPANYSAVVLVCQSASASLNVTLAGNQYTGNWGGGTVLQIPNGGIIALNQFDSSNTLISNSGQPAATIQTTANVAFTTALNVLAPNLAALTRDVLFNLGVSQTNRNACTWSFEYQGVGSNANNMKFNFFGTAVFFSITAGGIVSTLDNTLDNGAGASTFAGLMTLNGGTDTAGSAPVLTALGAVSGTALQLSDTTRDYMVYLEVTTSGTATSISMGPTSAASAVTILSSVAVTAGNLYSFKLPAGWFFKWTGTGTAIGNQNAVGT